MLADILRLLVYSLAESLDNGAGRGHDKVVELPIRGVFIARNRSVDLVVEELGGHLHRLDRVVLARLRHKVKYHERGGVGAL